MVKLKSSICLHNLDNPELDFRVGKGFKRKPILWNSRQPLGRVRQKLHHIVHHANEDLSPPQFLGRYALSKSRCCPREGPHGQFSHTKWAELGQKVGWYQDTLNYTGRPDRGSKSLPDNCSKWPTVTPHVRGGGRGGGGHGGGAGLLAAR